MTIERLGPVDPVQRPNQTNKAQRPAEKQPTDSVSFSDEAVMKAEVYRVAEQVNRAEDIRADRVAEVKRKLEDPNYINDVVVEQVADQIIDMFGV
jgi:negative regulator of flagellin synthesis FlgM